MLRLRRVCKLAALCTGNPAQGIGALGDGHVHLRFQDKADSPNAIAMLEELWQEYGKIFVIFDNALAHKSKLMQDYLASVNGDVILHFLPTPSPTVHSITQLRFSGARSSAQLPAGSLRVGLRR